MTFWMNVRAEEASGPIVAPNLVSLARTAVRQRRLRKNAVTADATVILKFCATIGRA
jgi:hypothetical protein